MCDFSVFFFSFSVDRDMAHRGRSLKGVLEQYFSTVKPAHDEFIAPVSTSH